MAVTRKDVEQVAALARLYYPDEEKDEIAATMNNILAYFDKLSELDTDAVEPLTHILPVENVMRADDVALANAPKHARGHFVIPRVIE